MLLLMVLPLAAAFPDTVELRVVGTHFARIYEHAAPDQYVGLGPDLVREVCKRIGATARFEIYPWARAQAMVEYGEADILVGPYKNPERELRFAFSEQPFYQDRMLLYRRTDKAFVWNGDYSSLRNKRIAAVHGWAYGASFDQARNALQVSNAPTLEIGLQMLLHERVELLATNERNTEALLPGMSMTGKVASLPQVLDIQNGYFAFPRTSRHDALRARFNAEFNSMVTRGELAEIARKHGVNVP